MLEYLTRTLVYRTKTLLQYPATAWIATIIVALPALFDVAHVTVYSVTLSLCPANEHNESNYSSLLRTVTEYITSEN